MRKQEIIYIAVDNRDADSFFENLYKPGIIADSYIRIDKRNKTFETSKFQVRAVPLSDFCKIVTMRSAKYYLQSVKPFTTQLSMLENRYNELEMIKTHLIEAFEIDTKMLVNLLNGEIQ